MDHHNGCRNHRGGRHRVHHNAQLAVVGIGLVGMQMRHLGNGQKREQDEAQDRHYGQHACAAAISREV